MTTLKMHLGILIKTGHLELRCIHLTVVLVHQNIEAIFNLKREHSENKELKYNMIQDRVLFLSDCPAGT